MKQWLLLPAMLLAWLGLDAQDTYHTALNNTLQNGFGLPANATWVLPDTETATLASAFSYGAVSSVITPNGQSFTQGRNFVVLAGNNPWDAGHFYPNQNAVSLDDKCLFILWLRSPTSGAKVNVFVENASTYFKEAYATINLSGDWKMFAIPFSSTDFYEPNSLNLGLHLANLSQVVEIGGVACLNYKNTLDLSQLPVLLNNDTYPGIEPDAPWRTEAATSIEQLRKANLNVRVLDQGGNQLPGAVVQVEMLQHEFKFGTAVVSSLFNGANANTTYEQNLINLDGQGHGFNEIVFENDLKWPAWEQHWFSNWAEIADDVQWLQDHDISMRGHNLVWPGWGNLPDDMEANQNNPAYLLNRIRNHQKAIQTYPGIGPAMADWDVLNEITTNTDLATALAGTPGFNTGREVYRDIFQLADSLSPDATLYLNDYVAIEQGDASTVGIDTWKSRLDEMLNAGAPVEGIGFQGHFSASPTGIPRVKEIYDEFWSQYGLEAKVTEYDINTLVPAAVQASYMRDILTISFAHPSMKGFLMWGFWDGAHWLNNAPVFNEDWTLKPSGEAFIDQVFHQWWTNTQATTNSLGEASIRGFRGKYRIKVSCGNAMAETFVTLDGDKTVTLSLNCTSETREQATGNLAMMVYAAPDNVVEVSWPADFTSGRAHLCVFDALGRSLVNVPLEPSAISHRFDTSDWPAGIYYAMYKNGSYCQTKPFLR